MNWTKEYFDQKYAEVDPWKYFTSDYEQQKYKRQIDATKDHMSRELNTILEIGCAEGAHTKMLAEAFPSSEITAIDISPRAIIRAKDNLRLFENVKLVEADVIEFIDKNPDESFSIIIWSESIYYLGDRLPLRQLFEYIAEVINKLQPQGLLCMANILEQPNSPEMPLTKRAIMEYYYNMFCSLAMLIHHATFWESKKESGSLHEYQIWLFRRT